MKKRRGVEVETWDKAKKPLPAARDQARGADQAEGRTSHRSAAGWAAAVPRSAAQRGASERASAAAGMVVRLRDCSRVVIRPIEPEDREALAEGFRRLSPESRYRRFLAPRSGLSERDLDYLTHVDHRDHEALVAVEETAGEGVGVARYVRTGPDVAEPAIVVADDWQNRGVGTALLDALVKRARQEGICRFEATVLACNEDALRLLERLGDTSREQLGPEVELKIDLPEPEPTARIRPLLRQFAIGAFEPACALLERSRPRDWAFPRQ